ncbi:MAG: VCBS repeat-containing protein [Candidatus Adiutrix sp.]|jgi:hypothetical protein|nr:VCBS repeat-containing protein [Candidatus Adiutrix sp.]
MKIRTFILGLAALALIGSGAALAAEDGEGGKRHPSYNLMGRDASRTAADSPLNPNFVVADEARMSEGKFWRSGFINETLVGMTLEDVDGDGKNEVVYVSNRNVYVSRMGAGKMQQLAKYSFDPTDTIVSVDAMSLTGGGGQEIIVSVQNDQGAPASRIFSFSGSELQVLASNIPWYLRVTGGPGGRFLAGQRGSSSKGDVYSGQVMRMSFDGSKVKSQGSAGLPSGVDVFNFTLGRIGSGGMQAVAAIRFPSEHIFLYEGANRAWESKEEYGGTMNAIRQPMTAPEEKQREFLPSRLLITDIDRDGQNELVVAKNDRGGVQFMSNQRAFSGGAIQVFKYANMSLSPYFRTRSLPGPAVDYALGDFFNDGTIQLVTAVVTEQDGGLLKEGRSVIISYELTTNASAE